MIKTESLSEFYRYKTNQLPANLEYDTEHFNVLRLEDCLGPGKTSIQYSRRDFYKISLVRGEHLYHYADKSFAVSGSALAFFNPDVPYTYECHSAEPTGYFCIFKEAFFSTHLRARLQELPMFATGGSPFYQLSDAQDRVASEIFSKMLAERDSAYLYKNDLIRNYITELIHYALKLQPDEQHYRHADANARITAVFRELLDRQFPIESPGQQFSLRSAKDFAEKLCVHVNHLNRAVRATTGKTTTTHIQERLLSEAKALLKHTRWSISEISYSLGFFEPAHFNHFFKKLTASTPSAFRS